MSIETSYARGSTPFFKGVPPSLTSSEEYEQTNFEQTLQRSLQHPDSQFTQIRFQVVNRKNFRLRPQDAECNLLPMVLIGNKRRACNFINHLNNSSSEYRSLLKLKRGELIPFMMMDAGSFPEFSMSSLNGRHIRLLCIYSEVFDHNVEKVIRNKLEKIESEEINLGFIKTVSTIYLRNANSNLQITRVKHRRNRTENDLNYFKDHLQSYSKLPEICWKDIIDMRIDVAHTSSPSTREECPICSESVQASWCAAYSCGHSSCLKCAGSIVSISQTCPFCRAKVYLDNIILKNTYVPSLFSSIKELLCDQIPHDECGAQSVIYVQNELAIQHIYNFLIQGIEPIEKQMEILTPNFNFSLLTEGSPHYYFLACSNDLISKLPNLTVIITCTDDENCKKLMLNFKSYGGNYGKADQKLIVLNAE